MSTIEEPTTTLSKTEQRGIIATTSITTPETLAQIVELAKIMAASGFYTEIKSAQQAAVVMILGAAYGLTPAQSLTGIHIVKGKPMLHYSVILAKVRQHPDYDYRVVKHDDTACEIEFTRNGKPCGTSTFTKADAQKSGTQNMDKHARTMLLARAASQGVKWYCPDVLNGMPTYTQGEIDADQDQGVAVEPTIADRLAADLAAKSAVEPEQSEDVIFADPETGERL